MNVAKEETKGSPVQPETQDFEGCRARLVATANQDFQAPKDQLVRRVSEV